MAMKVEIQSSKLITPSLPTPPSLRRYKLGFIDEFISDIDVGIVLFFPVHIHNPNFIARLEQSLQKTLTRFYPLAGRFLEEIQTIDCNDQGSRFICANSDIKLDDFLDLETKVKILGDLYPSNNEVDRCLLSIQVTTFKCGGLAIALSASHKLVDASTLCIVMNEWATINREENETEFTGPGFNSNLLFPSRGLRSIPVPPPNDPMFRNLTRIKLSFSESVISHMKTKGNNSTRRWSKVQLVGAIIWKAFIYADQAINNNIIRESQLIQPINLRGKMGSFIPKNSCGNIWGHFVTECNTLQTTEQFIDCLSDSVKNTITTFSKGHHDSKQGQDMVMNSLYNFNALTRPIHTVGVGGWCKFPFYETDFGLGKPIWIVPATAAIKGDHTTCLMDDAQGNGVEAYVCQQVKDVPYFEEALEHVKDIGA